MQSTLFFSLQQAARLAAQKGLVDELGRRLHIPEDGALLSPGVHVFREGTSHGYAPRADGGTRLAAVISIAMPNMNSANGSSPLEWRSKEFQEVLIERKLHAVLQGAALVEADILVLPDLGCGVFGNSAWFVGYLFGRVLRAYRGFFSEIVMTGNEDFHAAVILAAGPNYVPCLGDRLPCLEIGDASICGESCGQAALEVVRTISHSLHGQLSAQSQESAEKSPGKDGMSLLGRPGWEGSAFSAATTILALLTPSLCCCSADGLRKLAIDLASGRQSRH